MAPIHTVISIALCLSTGGLALAETLLTFYNQDPDNFLIYITVHTFLFFLVPCTFFSGILLLIIHVSVPPPRSPVPDLIIKHLTMVTQAIAFITLLVGVRLMIHVAVADATVRNTVKAVVIGAVAVMMYKPFKMYFDLARQTTSGFVLAFVELCISTGTLFNCNNSISHVPVRLLLFCNFILGTVLEFLRICVPADRFQAPGHAVLISIESRLTCLMSFITVVLGLFMMVALMVRIV